MKYHAKYRRSVSVRTLVVMLALVLMVGCAVGGTLAWLVAKTDPVVNTFTYGDINITLTEDTGSNYKIIPGVNIAKDPKVTVEAGSEACWLFVKVDEENWPTFTEADGKTRKVSYTLADVWTALPNVPGVYYREVGAVSADTDFEVLEGNKVTVSENLTKAEVNGIAEGIQPKLTFTAYAVQKDGIADAATAWGKVDTTASNP